MKFVCRVLAIALLPCAAACSGSISGRSGSDPGRAKDGIASGDPGQSPSPTGSGGGGAAAAPARVRRLTATEIQNATRDLFLGDASAPDVEFPAETPPRGYDNRFDALGFSELFATSLQAHAEAVAAAAVARLGTLLPSCGATPASEAAQNQCAADLVTGHAPRVFRRPVTDQERADLLALYAEARKAAPFERALAAVIEAMLQSPAFVFRTELGDPARRSAKSPLTPYERASDLAFFLWRSTPDDDLLAAAGAGKLQSAAGVADQARRLLASPRAKPALRSFVATWLETNGVATVNRDKTAYPAWSAALAADMAAELDAFVDLHAWGPRGFEELLTSNATQVSGNLATLYGASVSGASRTPLDTDPRQRGGVFSLPAFVVTHSPPVGFSPVGFGRYVRDRVLCQTLPDPPANVPSLPAPSPATTDRERFAQHESNPSCSGCHAMMDPVGFGFERYDGVGRYRDRDGATALTGEGELSSTDVDGKFVGAAELGRRLASSRQARDCFVENLFAVALGRSAGSGGDAAALAGPKAAFGQAGGNVLEALVALTTTDAFLFRDSTALAGGDAR